jgi:Ran GTPase-activating protein (RanGAP) involved in mRNA processing and transport
MQCTIKKFLTLNDGQLAQLTELDFFEEDLANLPSLIFDIYCNKLSKCHNLKDLYLYNNNLADLSADHLQLLFEKLQQCYNLNKLDLSNNNLSWFDLEKIKILRNFLFSNISLNVINLSYNSIGYLGVEKFSVLISSLFKLQEINLNSNQLDKLTAEEFVVFCSILKNCRYLSNLSISSNNLATHNTLDYLLHSLSERKSLTIDFSNNKLGDASRYNWRNFMEGINLLNNIAHLDLTSNFDANCGQSLIELCHQISNLNTIQEINLSNNNLSAIPTIDYLIKLLSCQNIIKYNLSNNNMGKLSSNSFIALINKLSTTNHLVKLDISNNKLYKIADISWAALCNSLQQHSKLQYLNFSFNSVGLMPKTKLQPLIELIVNNSCVELIFNTNQLGDILKDNLELLCDGLVNCIKLQALDLSFNDFEKFNDEHMQKLFNALECMPELKDLDLSYSFDNTMGERHKTYLTAFTRNSTSLENLTLENQSVAESEFLDARPKMRAC